MDYIVASCLKIYGELPKTVTSYDIVCYWSKLFLERMKMFPDHIKFNIPQGPGGLRYAIPKYHFRAHKEEGHNKFSFHYMNGVGRVCGEQIERTWPKHSELAGSTSEMGHGARQNTLDDHLGCSNWRVVTNLGKFRQYSQQTSVFTLSNRKSPYAPTSRGRGRKSGTRCRAYRVPQQHR